MEEGMEFTPRDTLTFDAANPSEAPKDPEGRWSFENMLKHNPMTGNRSGMPLPPELRARICAHIAHGVSPVPHIAKHFAVSKQTVYKLKRQVAPYIKDKRATAIPGPRSFNGGRQCILSEEQNVQLVNLALRFKDRTIEDLRRDMQNLYPTLHVSTATIQRALHRAQVRSMRAPPSDPRSNAGEAHSEEVRQFLRYQPMMDPFRTIFFDETSFDNKVGAGKAYGTDDTRPVTLTAKGVAQTLVVYAGIMLRQPDSPKLSITPDMRKSMEENGFYVGTESQEVSMLIFWYFPPFEKVQSMQSNRDQMWSLAFFPIIPKTEKCIYTKFMVVVASIASSSGSNMKTENMLDFVANSAIHGELLSQNIKLTKVGDGVYNMQVNANKTYRVLLWEGDVGDKHIWRISNVEYMNDYSLPRVSLLNVKNGSDVVVRIAHGYARLHFNETSTLVQFEKREGLNYKVQEVLENNITNTWSVASSNLTPLTTSTEARLTINTILDLENEMLAREFLELNNVATSYMEDDEKKAMTVGMMHATIENFVAFRLDGDKSVTVPLKTKNRADFANSVRNDMANEKKKATVLSFARFLHHVSKYLRGTVDDPTKPDIYHYHDFESAGTLYMLHNIGEYSAPETTYIRLMLLDLAVRKISISKILGWALYDINSNLPEWLDNNIHQPQILEDDFVTYVNVNTTTTDTSNSIYAISGEALTRLQRVLVHLPYTFVWDNDKAHGALLTTSMRQSWMHRWVQSHLGINRAIFLPPLDPVYNPVELLFRFTKYHVSQRIRKLRAADVSLLTVKEFVNDAFRSVHVSHLVEWLHVNCYPVSEDALKASGLATHVQVPADGVILNTATNELSKMSTRCRVKLESAMPRFRRVWIPTTQLSAWVPYLPPKERQSLADIALLVTMCEPLNFASISDESTLDNALLVYETVHKNWTNIQTMDAFALKDAFNDKLKSIGDNHFLVNAYTAIESLNTFDTLQVSDSVLNEILDDRTGEPIIGVIAGMLQIDPTLVRVYHAQLGLKERVPARRTPRGTLLVPNTTRGLVWREITQRYPIDTLRILFNTQREHRIAVAKLRVLMCCLAQKLWPELKVTSSSTTRMGRIEEEAMKTSKQSRPPVNAGDELRQLWDDVYAHLQDKRVCFPHVPTLLTNVIYGESIDYGAHRHSDTAAADHMIEGYQIPRSMRGHADALIYLLHLAKHVEHRIDNCDEIVIHRLLHDAEAVPHDAGEHQKIIIGQRMQQLIEELQSLMKQPFVRPIDPHVLRRKYEYAKSRRSDGRRYAGYEDFVVADPLDVPGETSSLLPESGSMPKSTNEVFKLYTIEEFWDMRRVNPQEYGNVPLPWCLLPGDTGTVLTLEKKDTAPQLKLKLEDDTSVKVPLISVENINPRITKDMDRYKVADTQMEVENENALSVLTLQLSSTTNPTSTTTVSALNVLHPKYVFVKWPSGKMMFQIRTHANALKEKEEGVRFTIWENVVDTKRHRLTYDLKVKPEDADVYVVINNADQTRVEMRKHILGEGVQPLYLQLKGNVPRFHYVYYYAEGIGKVRVHVKRERYEQGVIYVDEKGTNLVCRFFDFRHFLEALSPTRPRKHQILWFTPEIRVFFIVNEFVARVDAMAILFADVQTNFDTLRDGHVHLCFPSKTNIVFPIYCVQAHRPLASFTKAILLNISDLKNYLNEKPIF